MNDLARAWFLVCIMAAGYLMGWQAAFLVSVVVFGWIAWRERP